MTPECPSLESLAAFLEHALAPHEQALIEEHLAGCQTCRETIRLAIPPDSGSGASPG